jgi:hypothetical protein
MSFIVDHHGSLSHVKKDCCYDYMAYIYIYIYFGFEKTPPPGKRTLWAQVSE